MSQLATRELIGRVHQCDCRVLVDEMVRAGLKADAIVTSPPYPQSKDKPEDMRRYARDGTAEEQRAKIEEASYQHGRPEMKGETGLAVRIMAPDWLDWFLPIAKALLPTVRQDGNFILDVDSCYHPQGHLHWGIYSLPERMEQIGWVFAASPIWVKPNGAPIGSPGRLRHSWEFCYHFSPSADWSGNIDALRRPHAEKWCPSRSSAWRRRGGGYPAALPHSEGARPPDVFVHPVGGTRWHSVGGTHSAAMSLALAVDLVTYASRPGELVFDPFLGSGTTPLAVELLNQRNPGDPPRRWIGCELTKDAADIAKRRIQMAQKGYFDEDLEPEDAPQRQLGFGGKD